MSFGPHAARGRVLFLVAWWAILAPGIPRLDFSVAGTFGWVLLVAGGLAVALLPRDEVQGIALALAAMVGLLLGRLAATAAGLADPALQTARIAAALLTAAALAAAWTAATRPR